MTSQLSGWRTFITLKVVTNASRMATSILTNLGLKELITKTPEEYEELAVI